MWIPLVVLIQSFSWAERCFDQRSIARVAEPPSLVKQLTQSYWVTIHKHKRDRWQAWYDGFEFDLQKFRVVNHYIKDKVITSLVQPIRKICWHGSDPSRLTVWVRFSRVQVLRQGDLIEINNGLVGSYTLEKGSREAHQTNMLRALSPQSSPILEGTKTPAAAEGKLLPISSEKSSPSQQEVPVTETKTKSMPEPKLQLPGEG